MPGNMSNLMKQAQRMQRQMEESQKNLDESEFTAKAGGGAVEVIVSGKKEIKKLTLDKEVVIDKEVVDPDDVEMLQDLIVAALNEAFAQVDAASEAAMGKLSGGLGGFGF